jgi:hypothetical protein
MATTFNIIYKRQIAIKIIISYQNNCQHLIFKPYRERERFLD